MHQLSYAVAVADTANFTRAARRCRVVQSALSQQIRRLEDELGTRLFDRNSRSVRLTAAGEVFVAGARQILDSVERVRTEVAAISGLLRGRLAIGTISYLPRIDLPRTIARFHREHPGVSVRLRQQVTDELLDSVRTGRLDLAFVSTTPDAALSGVATRELLREEFVAVVAGEHALAGEESVPLDRLAAETFVEYLPGSGLRTQNDQAFQRQGHSRHIGFEVGGIEELADLVALGLGVALLPESMADQLARRHSDAHHRLHVPHGPRRQVLLAWSDPPSPAALAFLDLISAEQH